MSSIFGSLNYILICINDIYRTSLSFYQQSIGLHARHKNIRLIRGFLCLVFNMLRLVNVYYRLNFIELLEQSPVFTTPKNALSSTLHFSIFKPLAPSLEILVT